MCVHLRGSYGNRKGSCADLWCSLAPAANSCTFTSKTFEFLPFSTQNIVPGFGKNHPPCLRGSGVWWRCLHLDIFAPAHLHTFKSNLYISTSSNFHLLTSSHLHILASPLLRFLPSAHLQILTYSHLHSFLSSHLRFISSYLHIRASSNHFIFTPAHIHSCASSPDSIPVVPHKAVAEVSKIGNL